MIQVSEVKPTNQPHNSMRNPIDVLGEFKQISVCCGADMEENGLICSKCGKPARYEEVLDEKRKDK